MVNITQCDALFCTLNYKIAHNFTGQCVIFAFKIVYLVNRSKFRTELVKIAHKKAQKCAILHIEIFSDITIYAYIYIYFLLLVLFFIQGITGNSLVVNTVGAFFLFHFSDDCLFQWLEIYDGTKPYTIVPRYKSIKFFIYFTTLQILYFRV